MTRHIIIGMLYQLQNPHFHLAITFTINTNRYDQPRIRSRPAMKPSDAIVRLLPIQQPSHSSYNTVKAMEQRFEQTFQMNPALNQVFIPPINLTEQSSLTTTSFEQPTARPTFFCVIYTCMFFKCFIEVSIHISLLHSLFCLYS